jgi:hypothetical protein
MTALSGFTAEQSYCPSMFYARFKASRLLISVQENPLPE